MGSVWECCISESRIYFYYWKEYTNSLICKQNKSSRNFCRRSKDKPYDRYAQIMIKLIIFEACSLVRSLKDIKRSFKMELSSESKILQYTSKIFQESCQIFQVTCQILSDLLRDLKDREKIFQRSFNRSCKIV